MNTHKTYYAEGSMIVMDEGQHIKKDSFKLYSPDGKKVNINVDLNGDKMYLRNAKVSDLIPKTLPKNDMARIMPIRSNHSSLLEELEKLTTPQKKDKKNPKTKSTQGSKKVKSKKTKTIKKSNSMEKIQTKIPKTTSKSMKKIKKRKKSVRSNTKPMSEQPASLLSATLI